MKYNGRFWFCKKQKQFFTFEWEEEKRLHKAEELCKQQSAGYQLLLRLFVIFHSIDFLSTVHFIWKLRLFSVWKRLFLIRNGQFHAKLVEFFKHRDRSPNWKISWTIQSSIVLWWNEMKWFEIPKGQRMYQNSCYLTVFWEDSEFFSNKNRRTQISRIQNETQQLN